MGSFVIRTGLEPVYRFTWDITSNTILLGASNQFRHLIILIRRHIGRSQVLMINPCHIFWVAKPIPFEMLILDCLDYYVIRPHNFVFVAEIGFEPIIYCQD